MSLRNPLQGGPLLHIGKPCGEHFQPVHSDIQGERGERGLISRPRKVLLVLARLWEGVSWLEGGVVLRYC